MNHHVMAMEVTIDYGYFVCDKIALFDDRDITPEEINKNIREDVDNDCFALLSKKQYENIFRSLKGE